MYRRQNRKEILETAAAENMLNDLYELQQRESAERKERERMQKEAEQRDKERRDN